jgi:hypothetical protein
VNGRRHCKKKKKRGGGRARKLKLQLRLILRSGWLLFVCGASWSGWEVLQRVQLTSFTPRSSAKAGLTHEPVRSLRKMMGCEMSRFEEFWGFQPSANPLNCMLQAAVINTRTQPGI